MSSREQLAIMDLIAGMKKANKRRAYDSDSDSDIEHTNNRGNKLKKRARFVRQGKLGPPTGPSVYREVVEHAGYQRAVISRNPPLVDEEGYDIDSDDDEQRIQQAVTSAAEQDPYSSIHLDQLLAPLTAVTDLPNHPTLSRPFTSKALTELVTQGRDLMHKEHSALWKVRPLLTKLSGDHTWASCEMMLGPNDHEYFDDNFMSRTLKHDAKGSQLGHVDGTTTPRINGRGKAQSSANGESSRIPDGTAAHHDVRKTFGEDITMTDGDDRSAEETVASHEKDTDANGDKSSHTVLSDSHMADMAAEIISPLISKGHRPDDHEPNGDSLSQNGAKRKGKQPANGVGANEGDVDVEMGGATNGVHPGARSITNGSRAPSPSPSIESFIHPIFLAPKSAHPDRNVGLPEQEAEDVRRLLQLYIQKQEEVCRGTKKLYDGLLRADRLRGTVLKWSKAEAHVGANRDMSDGEDWYDKDEWGLSEDLKKGQDEEEEDTTQTQKKTRNRR